MPMQLTKREQPRTLATLLAQGTTSVDSGTELPAASDSVSLDDVLDTDALRLRWANSVRHHVSRQLLYLRRAQGLRQSEVAKKAGTSQPKIARIEAGEENITLDTVERVVNAMDGRFIVLIVPANRPVTIDTEWWNYAPPTSDDTWYVRLALGKQDSTGRHLLFWLSQPHTLTPTELIALEEAK